LRHISSVELDWDPGKSAKIKAERGASFEELAQTLAEHGPEAQYPGNRLGQELWIIRHKRQIWVLVLERRLSLMRIVTAYPSRKWRKKHGT